MQWWEDRVGSLQSWAGWAQAGLEGTSKGTHVREETQQSLKLMAKPQQPNSGHHGLPLKLRPSLDYHTSKSSTF